MDMLPKKWLTASAAVMLVVGGACFAAVLLTSSGYLFRNDGTGYFILTQSMVLDFDTEVLDDYLELDARVPADSPAMSGLRTRREPDPERVIFPWPIGSGLVMAPFYAAGYGLEWTLATVSGREPDAYGVLPQVFFGLGSLFYGWLGFWATFLCCRRLADPWDAGVAALTAILAGPLVFYIFFNPTMAHVSSFSLAAVFVYLWWRSWETIVTSRRYALGLGLLLGLLVIVRYQNAVFGVLLLASLWRFLDLKATRYAARLVTYSGLGFLAPLSLQGLHLWKIQGSLAGDWSTDEGLTLGRNLLDTSSPFFFEALFSCQHGAIYWTPVIGLGFLALMWAAGAHGWARALVLVLVVNVYLIGCLRGPVELMESLDAPPSPDETHWSGGHAFGMRYLSEVATLLALGLAYGLKRFDAGLKRRLLHAVLALLVFWNGVLLLAYGSGEISRVGCVTHAEMASGAARALGWVLPTE